VRGDKKKLLATSIIDECRFLNRNNTCHSEGAKRPKNLKNTLDSDSVAYTKLPSKREF
jgi:hypothetical protein